MATNDEIVIFNMLIHETPMLLRFPMKYCFISFVKGSMQKAQRYLNGVIESDRNILLIMHESGDAERQWLFCLKVNQNYHFN
jgi:hypothetical protein